MPPGGVKGGSKRTHTHTSPSKMPSGQNGGGEGGGGYNFSVDTVLAKKNKVPRHRLPSCLFRFMCASLFVLIVSLMSLEP